MSMQFPRLPKLSIDWDLIAWIALILGFISVAIWAIAEDEKQWQQFVIDNNCKVIEHIRGATSTGFVSGYAGPSGSAGGVVTTIEPDRTVYQCDDGIKYTR